MRKLVLILATPQKKKKKKVIYFSLVWFCTSAPMAHGSGSQNHKCNLSHKNNNHKLGQVNLFG